MKIVYGKELTEQEEVIVKEISFECGILFDTARLLFYRNINSVQKAKAFLSPGKKRFLDPFLFKNMQSVVDRITSAKERKENVVICGDYDADGICASTVMFSCFRDFGIESTIIIPERQDGYGLNMSKLNQMEKEKHIDLLITVDCGISEKDNIELIKENGTDVIVTDHHEPPEILPECLIINPKVENSGYPFNGLCGAGVAYKVCRALIGKKADFYLDFVSLATVADNMDLIEENRDIVVEGFKIFNSDMKLPFKYLLSEKNKVVNANTITYSLAPRINAGGRMGNANCALELFNSKDESRIYELAVKLNEYNLARQLECDNTYLEAKDKIEKEGLSQDPIILVADDKWRTGIIGIVASKLVEDYSRPVIVFSGEGNSYKGSSRSINGINILNLIVECSDLLLGYGGHSQAAGISVEKDKLEALRKRICFNLGKQSGKIESENEIYVDLDLDEEIDVRFAKEVELLEPCGIGNKKPIFTITENSLNPKQLKFDSPHYKFETKVVEVLDFNGENDIPSLMYPTEKKLIIELNVSTFNRVESIKGYLKKVVLDLSDFSKLDNVIFENELSKCCCKQPTDFEYISSKDVKIEQGHGTVYTLSDYKNIERYAELSKLPRDLFLPTDSSHLNTFVMSLKELPKGYKNVVFLDNPLFMPALDCKVTVVNDVEGKRAFGNITTDREEFKQVFDYLNNNVGRELKTVVAEIDKNSEIKNKYQFIFASKVFFELNFFETVKGVLKRNIEKKSPLTNSDLYSIINRKIG